MQCFITGATGFLGRHVIASLLAEFPDLKLYILLRDIEQIKNTPWLAKLDNLVPVIGTLGNYAKWHQALKDIKLDAVIHLAALVRHSRYKPEDIYQSNIQGTLNILTLAASNRCRMIYVSTSGTVGVFKKLSESADEHADYCEAAVKHWPYYHSKILAEQEARYLAEKSGVELIILRPPVLLGPGDHRGRATSHMARLIAGKLPFMLKGGYHFVDIRDVAKALVRCLQIKNPKPVYHLAGFNCELKTFFEMVAEIAKCKAPKFTIDAKWLKPLSFLLQNKAHFILPDPVVLEMASHYWGIHSRYAKDDLGFVSRDPMETLKDTIRWMQAN